jgi:hypothetical protein
MRAVAVPCYWANTLLNSHTATSCAPFSAWQATNEDVYAGTVRELVTGVLYGINTTIFAYGATGSGKTFTMVPGCAQWRNVGFFVKLCV